MMLQSLNGQSSGIIKNSNINFINALINLKIPNTAATSPMLSQT